jgi:Spy/CpxP family protein refolding chaperone
MKMILISAAIQTISRRPGDLAPDQLHTSISYEVTMTNILSRRNLLLFLLALSTTLILALSVTSAGAQQSQQTETQQAPANQDPLTELAKDLSPEQRQQIRLAVESTKAERNAANQRLRQAQVAYEEALDADNPSEEVIEKRAREVGEAQASLLRARANMEIRIRRVLTPAQQAKLRELRIAQREAIRLQRQERRIENGGGNQGRRGPLQNQRNGMGPLNPQQRRNGLPRKPGF